MLNNIPPVVRNLLIINILMLLATYAIKAMYGVDLVDILGYHFPLSQSFKPFQYITYMFLHADFFHLFFNMFALYMFGRILEQVWGGKRFFVYYIVTGIGAVIVQTIVNYFEYKGLLSAAAVFSNSPTPESMELFINQHFKEFYGQVYTKVLSEWSDDPSNPLLIMRAKEFVSDLVQFRIDVPTVGASGAVFGILLAFGMLFPNTELMLLNPPMPIKAKYMVIIYGVLELFMGVANVQSNVAHFAHLGGMLFGFFLILYWNKTKKDYFY